MRAALQGLLLCLLWAASGAPALAAGPAESALRPETRREDNAAEHTLLEIRMPQPPDMPPYGPLRAWLQQWLAAETTRFKALAAAHWADAAPGPETSPSGLWIDYEVLTERPQLLSLRFEISPYFSGTAHPQHACQSVNYHLPSQRLLRLVDILNSPEALARLSAEARVVLLAPASDPGLDPEWVVRGLTPVPENFACFNLTPAGLLLSFPPYQVGPYAAGTQTVLLPYTRLRDSLKPSISALFN